MSLEAKGLRKSFGDVEVLRGIDLSIRAGELVALLGPSGGGKSTVLRVLSGLERADAGEVWFDGRRIDHLDAAQRGVGFVFQHYALFRHLDVRDNVAFGLRVRGVEPKVARGRAEELLSKVGLAGFERRWPDELSGGQRQRVALARALAAEPRFLLLDEPFGALDAKVRAELRDWLRRLHDDVGATTILVTHDQEEALAVADRVVVIKDGLVEQDATPAELVDAPATEFVARFVGEVNVIDGVVGVGLALEGTPVPVPVSGHAVGARVRAVVRSHELRVAADEAGVAVVRRIVPVDDRVRVELDVGGRTLVARVPRGAPALIGVGVGSRVSVEAAGGRAFPLPEGR
jgi:sulfate transport system ATP-binding protein